MALCSWATIANVLGVATTLGAYMVVIFFFVGMLELPFVFQKIECTKALAEKLKKVMIASEFSLLSASILCFFCPLVAYVAGALLIATGFAYGLAFLGPRGSAAKKQGQTEKAAAADGGEDGQQLIGDVHEEEVRVHTRDLLMILQTQQAAPADPTKPDWAQSAGKTVGAAVGAAMVQSWMSDKGKNTKEEDQHL